MCDLAAALNPGNAGRFDWDCSGGIPTPSKICTWGRVTCNGDLSVTGIRLTFSGLSGTLPSSIGSITTLTSLDLSANSIGGIIPSSIGELKLLDSIYLSQNSFIGILPSSLEYLTLLTLLNLCYNSFTDILPDSIGYLTQMTELRLNSNQFKGTVPQSLCNAPLYLVSIYNSGITCYPGCLSSIGFGLLVDNGLTVCTPSPTGSIISTIISIWVDFLTSLVLFT